MRFYAIRGLQDLTGETFGYVWYAGDRERGSALRLWKAWLDADGGGGADAQGLADGGGESEQQ